MEDARLAKLVLLTGDTTEVAMHNVSTAFARFQHDASTLDTVLEQILVLDEANYCKAILCLLMIELQRQKERSNADVSLPQEILTHFDQRLQEGTGTLDWSTVVPTELMIEWFLLIREHWSELDLECLYHRCNDRALSHPSYRFTKQGS